MIERESISLILTPLALAGFVIAFLVHRRRRLRLWHLVVPLLLLLVTAPLALRIVRDLRTQAGGEGGAYGRLVELFVLIGIAPVAFCSAVAVPTVLLLLARHGFADEAELAGEPGVPWYAWLFRPRTRRDYALRLYVSLGVLAFALLLRFVMAMR